VEENETEAFLHFPGIYANHWFGSDISPSRPWLIDEAFGTNSDLFSTSLIFCMYCSCDGLACTSQFPNLWDACLFNDIIDDTGSPALALQSYLTSALQRLYYSHLPFFKEKGNASTSSFVNRLAPTSRKGYWVVMGLIGIHIVVCLITIILFRRTKYSYLGNAWTTFAQIANSKEAQDI